MDTRNAERILQDNYNIANDSFLFFLHERDRFCADKFEELCQSVEALGGSESAETARKITFCYQAVLKELIWHFNPKDSSQIKDLPENYMDYIENFDCALARFYIGRDGK